MILDSDEFGAPQEQKNSSALENYDEISIWYREFLIKRISEGMAWKINLPDRLEVSASGDLAYTVGYYDYTVVTKGEAKNNQILRFRRFEKAKGRKLEVYLI